jgi:hypothetical protein
VSLDEERKKVIRANYAAFNNGDVEGILKNLHPDIELIGADEEGNFNEGEAWRGHDEARRFYQGIRREMGMHWIEIEKLETDGGAIVATVWLHGENEAHKVEGAVPAVRRHVFDGLLIKRVETYRHGWHLPFFDQPGEDP